MVPSKKKEDKKGFVSGHFPTVHPLVILFDAPTRKADKRILRQQQVCDYFINKAKA